jgi:predicted RNase H-like nuclease (RuvC/YqgF family)
MEATHDDILSGLRQRIKSIISLYEDQKSKNQALLNKNKELGDKIEHLENKLEELDKKYEHLKIAKVLSSVPGDDVHATKLQVNRIVREIDKCIALLNR